MAPSAMSRWTQSSPRPGRSPTGWTTPAAPTPSPDRADHLRPARRGRRLQRTVDRADRQGARPSRDVVLVEGREVGWAASGRNGGFCAASSPTACPTGSPAGPVRSTPWSGWAPATSTPSRRRSPATPSTATSSAPARSTSPPSRTRRRNCAPGTTRSPPGSRRRHRVPGHRRGPRAGRLAHLPRRAVRPPGRGHAQPGPPRLGPEAGLPRPRGARVRAHARAHPEAVRRRHVRPHAVRRGPRPPGRARHQCLPQPGPPGPPLHRPGLRLRPDDRAAHRGAARLDRLEEPPGPGDSANQFHYFRLSSDNRILWGGYDAVYPYGGRVRAEYDDRPETYARLAGHFFTCFPQLEGVRFTHAWGGAIDTCSRFSAFFGTAHAGRWRTRRDTPGWVWARRGSARK